jgi:hypothetical protein
MTETLAWLLFRILNFGNLNLFRISDFEFSFQGYSFFYFLKRCLIAPQPILRRSKPN